MGAERPLGDSLAVVVGALGNLGPHWVGALADAGADVLAIDVRDDGADALAERAVAAGSSLEFERADVTDRARLEEIAEASLREAPHVLVNNVGIDQPPAADAQRFVEEAIPSQVFDSTLRANLLGTFHAIQVFGARMRDAGRGSIVNIGSVYASVAADPHLYDHLPGEVPFLKPPAYGASKAGVINLTRYFARLWGPRGVRVNALSPGGVGGGQDAEFVRKYCSRVPLGRMASADDLTGPLVFLASDESRYVTGHELLVDGGLTT